LIEKGKKLQNPIETGVGPLMSNGGKLEMSGGGL
jgi:hypothetical protein